MTWRDRIIADSEDRESWLAARDLRCGASDAAKFARVQSIDKYVLGKLTAKQFTGNAYTDSGNEWEPILLAYLGIPRNTFLVGSEEDEGLAATPDGLLEMSPAVGGGIVLAEVKAKHNRIIDGPTKAELRQMAFQQWVVGPDVQWTDFAWAEIVNGEMRTDVPKTLRFTPADLTDVLAGVLPIAREVLAQMRAIDEMEKEALSA